MISSIVVGAGGRATWAIPTLHQSGDFKLAAVVDLVPAKAQALLDHYGISDVPVYADLTECLRLCRPQAVVVCTPDGCHADVAVPALNAGCFVFLEKPLEVTRERCQAIIEADDAAGHRAFVGHNLRFAPMYRKIQSLLRDGAVGPVLTLEANAHYVGGRTYFRRWNRLQRMGGGLWITKSCHDLDILYWLAGKRPLAIAAFDDLTHYRPRADAPLHCRDCREKQTCPDAYPKDYAADFVQLAEVVERATGQRSDLCLWNSDKDTCDHGMAIVQFEGGAIATLTLNVVATDDQRHIKICGPAGRIEGDLEDQRIHYRKRYADADEIIEATDQTQGGHGGADLHILGAFADLIKRQPSMYISPREAAVSVLMGLAARQSSAEHRVVEVDLIE